MTSEPSPLPAPEAGGPFGVESFEQDDRLRLFAFTNAEKSRQYLWALRAMEHSRANYVVLLHASEVANSLRELRSEHGGKADVPSLSAEELSPLLDQLFFWGLLERSYDGARAASLAEYRNRHYVYQFSQPGYRAYRAVEDVLGARLDDVTLSRLVLPELLADLQDLAAANRAGDSELVYRKLNRLDSALADMAERAARFYLMLSELSHSTESSAEVFLTHKDALLAHLREFSSELERYAPRLAAAVADVAATGVEDLLERAAEADERIFRTPVDRLADWRQRWAGLVNWFTADTDSRRHRGLARHRPAERGRSVAGRHDQRGGGGAGAAPAGHRGAPRRGQPGEPAAAPGRLVQPSARTSMRRTRCSGWSSTSARPGTSAACIPIPS